MRGVWRHRKQHTSSSSPTWESVNAAYNQPGKCSVKTAPPCTEIGGCARRQRLGGPLFRRSRLLLLIREDAAAWQTVQANVALRHLLHCRRREVGASIVTGPESCCAAWYRYQNAPPPKSITGTGTGITGPCLPPKSQTHPTAQKTYTVPVFTPYKLLTLCSVFARNKLFIGRSNPFRLRWCHWGGIVNCYLPTVRLEYIGSTNRQTLACMQAHTLLRNVWPALGSTSP